MKADGKLIKEARIQKFLFCIKASKTIEKLARKLWEADTKTHVRSPHYRSVELTAHQTGKSELLV